MTREEKNEYNRLYRLKNKDKIKEKQKLWYENNKEKKNEYNKQYRLENKEKIKQQQQEYNKNNKEKIKEYYENNKESIKQKSKEYYNKNKKKISKSGKKYRLENKEKIKQRDWKYNLKKYNLTENEYYEILNNQNGCCKICKTNQIDLNTPLHIDHSHETGKIRGLLCNKCNQGLGLFNDDILLLTESIKYLQENM